MPDAASGPLFSGCGNDSFIRHRQNLEVPRGTPSRLKKVLKEAYKKADPMEVMEVLNLAAKTFPGFQKCSNTLFFCQGYFIELKHRDYANELLRKLNRVQDLKLSCAPELVQHARLNSKISLLITRLPGQWTDAPVPYKKVRLHVSPEKKKQFLAEMETLQANGMVHRFGTRSIEHWFVNPSTGAIVLNSWQSLEKNDARSSLEKVRKLLGLHS